MATIAELVALFLAIVIINLVYSPIIRKNWRYCAKLSENIEMSQRSQWVAKRGLVYNKKTGEWFFPVILKPEARWGGLIFGLIDLEREDHT